MDDAAYCAVGCPPNKTCPVADPNLGWVIGISRLHNPGTPRCCELDGNDGAFISTVRDIEEYGNQPHIVQHNPGTVGFRTAFYILVRAMDTSQGPWLLRIGEETLGFPPDVIDIQGFTINIIDDWSDCRTTSCLIDSGFEIELQIADIERQPWSWR